MTDKILTSPDHPAVQHDHATGYRYVATHDARYLQYEVHLPQVLLPDALSSLL